MEREREGVAGCKINLSSADLGAAGSSTKVVSAKRGLHAVAVLQGTCIMGIHSTP